MGKLKKNVEVIILRSQTDCERSIWEKIWFVDLIFVCDLKIESGQMFFGFWQVGWIWAIFGWGKFGGLWMSLLVLFILMRWLGVFRSYMYFRLKDHIWFLLKAYSIFFFGRNGECKLSQYCCFLYWLIVMGYNIWVSFVSVVKHEHVACFWPRGLLVIVSYMFEGSNVSAREVVSEWGDV